ncbi:hypothetical protein [Nitrosomonas sp. Nm166]|nr:hypothetical protein [Nitrosomonas sp. Nm166]
MAPTKSGSSCEKALLLLAARLMKKLGLQGVRRSKRYWTTTTEDCLPG